MQLTKRKALELTLVTIFVITSQYWVFGVFAGGSSALFQNHTISDLLYPSHSWSWLFRLLSITSGGALCIAIRFFTKPTSRIDTFLRYLLYGFAVLLCVDAIFPDYCPGTTNLCTLPPYQLFATYVHRIESVISVGIIFLTSAATVFKGKKFSQRFIAIVIFALLVVSIILEELFLRHQTGTWQRIFTLLSCLPLLYTYARIRNQQKTDPS